MFHNIFYCFCYLSHHDFGGDPIILILVDNIRTTPCVLLKADFELHAIDIVICLWSSHRAIDIHSEVCDEWGWRWQKSLCERICFQIFIFCKARFEYWNNGIALSLEFYKLKIDCMKCVCILRSFLYYIYLAWCLWLLNYMHLFYQKTASLNFSSEYYCLSCNVCSSSNGFTKC